MNTDTKILNKTFENQMQQHIKKYTEQVLPGVWGGGTSGREEVRKGVSRVNVV
jgi:hypothetical protein